LNRRQAAAAAAAGGLLLLLDPVDQIHESEQPPARADDGRGHADGERRLAGASSVGEDCRIN
jgi:hypothetical protein